MNELDKFIYEHELKCDKIVQKDEMFIDINDLGIILNETKYSVDTHLLIRFIHLELYNNIIELFDNIDDKYGIFVKIDSKNLNIGKRLNRYFTFNKIKIEDILEIKKMKSLKTYIESKQEEELFETLFTSLENKKFKDVLFEFIGLDKSININFGSNSKTKDSFILTTNKELSNMSVWTELESLCNRCGYKLNEYNKGDKWEYLFTPYHGELANDIVYNENNGIIYHLTSEYWYEKIKDKKFIPFRSEFGIDGKSRLYCWTGKFNKNLEQEICTFKYSSERVLNTNNKFGKYYQKNILLEIDLKKSKDKFNFYYDPNYQTTAIALYTKDNIPIDCITKLYKVKEFKIDKNYKEV